MHWKRRCRSHNRRASRWLTALGVWMFFVCPPGAVDVWAQANLDEVVEAGDDGAEAVAGGEASEGGDVVPLPPLGEGLEGDPDLASASLTEALPPLSPMTLIAVGRGEPLSMEVVVDVALARSPSLAAAEQKVAASVGQRLAAQGAFDLKLVGKLYDTPLGFNDTTRASLMFEQPTPVWGVEVYGGYRRGVGNWAEYYGNYETLPAGELALGLKLPLLADRAIDAQRAKLLQSELKVVVAEQALDAKALATYRDAAAAYWKWVAAGQRVVVANRQLALAERREKAIDALVTSGAVPAYERLENRRAILSRRQEVVKAQRKLEEASLKLSLYLRDEEGEPVSPEAARVPMSRDVPPELDSQVAERARREALERRPEVAMVRAEVDSAEVAVALADNQVAPELDVQVGVSQDLGEGSKELDKKLGPAVMEWGVNLKIPLQMRKARGARDSALARRDALRADLRLQMDKLRVEVDDALSELRAAERVVTVAREGWQIARLRAEAERRRFRLGSADLFKLNLLEDYAATAEAKYVDAVAAVHAARAAFWAATGVMGGR